MFKIKLKNTSSICKRLKPIVAGMQVAVSSVRNQQINCFVNLTKAGIHLGFQKEWIPASAGMTTDETATRNKAYCIKPTRIM